MSALPAPTPWLASPRLLFAAEGEWSRLLRAVLGAVVLLAVFLVPALIAPAGLGMGDVKLAALLQALLALVLLAARRVGLRGELPFGPAMLLGGALALGWTRLAP